MSGRIYKYDNIKCLLIFLVVFGHILNLFSGFFISNKLYHIIYSFHMPCFMFITGYFAKFNKRKILLHLIVPYFIFQSLYLLFERTFSGKQPAFQYSTPHWILWYIFTVAVFYILLPFIDTQNMKYQILVFGFSIALSLLAGYDDKIGYHLSLSRIFTFFPYFLSGYYIKKNAWNLCEINAIIKKKYLIILLLLCIAYSAGENISSNILYGSHPYSAEQYGPIVRLFLLVVAYVWIVFLIQNVPNKELPIISRIGQNTFAVYILHGFLVKIIGYNNLLHYSVWINLILSLAISVLITILLGNKWVTRILNKILHI